PRMSGQPTYVELWVEKAALEGVLHPLARRRHVTLMVNRGYSSTSAMYEAACRIDRACRASDGVIVADAAVLYLGDLDPSGEDMVRDIGDRLTKFLDGTNEEDPEDRETPVGWLVRRYGTVELEVEKLALTMDQVRLYNPPPNPAKRSDSRSDKFIAEFGSSSWEVDALPPNVLRQLIEDALDERIDAELVDRIVQQEKQQKRKLRGFMAGQGVEAEEEE
ncbi:MAG: hypothetical protein ABIK09_07010, partial [Pseudomonadota bacterium]